jgi:hypothetical protein
MVKYNVMIFKYSESQAYFDCTMIFWLLVDKAHRLLIQNKTEVKVQIT